MVAKQKLYINLKFLETLKDTPNTFQGFRFAAFVILEILGVVHFDPSPLVLGVGTQTLGVRRVKGVLQNMIS